MDLEKFISELRAELRGIDLSIIALQQIANPRLRARPPARLGGIVPKKRGRPKGSRNKPKGPAGMG
jgi:hypothetical protein